MLKSILVLLLFAGGPRSVAQDTMKKDMGSLQAAVESAITPYVFSMITAPKATPIEGFGVVVTVEVALEVPTNPFSGQKTVEQLKAQLTQRRNNIREKLTEMVKQQVLKSPLVDDTESLAVIVHIVPRADQPTQLVLTVKKAAPAQVNVKEF